MPQSDLLQRSNAEILTSEEKNTFISYKLIYTERLESEEEITKGLRDRRDTDLVDYIQ